MIRQIPLMQSLPMHPGAKNIKPEPRKMYEKDPKFDMFERKQPPHFYKKIVISRPPFKTSDSFTIAKQSDLTPIPALMYDKRNRLDVYKAEWYEPLPVALRKQKPVESLTNAQVALLSQIDDPTKKYFLLEMFKGKIAITTGIKTKLVGVGPLEAQTLDQALNRLIQKYTTLSNTNTVNDQNLKNILDEYYLEIKPIYAKWMAANPGSFDPIQELEAGLGLNIPAPIVIAPPQLQAPPAAIPALIPPPPQPPQPPQQQPGIMGRAVGAIGSVAGAVAPAIGATVGLAATAPALYLGFESLLEYVYKSSPTLATGIETLAGAHPSLKPAITSTLSTVIGPAVSSADPANITSAISAALSTFISTAVPANYVMGATALGIVGLFTAAAFQKISDGFNNILPASSSVSSDDVLRELTRNQLRDVFTRENPNVPKKETHPQLVAMIMANPNMMNIIDFIKRISNRMDDGPINQRVQKGYAAWNLIMIYDAENQPGNPQNAWQSAPAPAAQAPAPAAQAPAAINDKKHSAITINKILAKLPKNALDFIYGVSETNILPPANRKRIISIIEGNAAMMGNIQMILDFANEAVGPVGDRIIGGFQRWVALLQQVPADPAASPSASPPSGKFVYTVRYPPLSNTEINKIITDNNIEFKDIIGLVDLVYPDKTTEVADMGDYSIADDSYPYLNESISKKILIGRILAKPSTSIYDALVLFANIVKDNAMSANSIKANKNIAYHQIKAGLGKKKNKKGKKTATPKQYKAGGKQKTAREKQLARLIKLL